MTTATETLSNVVQFARPGEDDATSSMMRDAWPGIGAGELRDDMKKLIEAAVYGAFVRAQLQAPPAADNPFDAVYISELRADRFSTASRELIMAKMHLRDLSSTIQIDDGWDDAD